MIYITYYRLIPVIYFQRNEVLYLSYIILAFIVIGVLSTLLTGYLPAQHARVPPPMPDVCKKGPMPTGLSFPGRIRHHLFLFAIVLLKSVLLHIRNWRYESATARYNDKLMLINKKKNRRTVDGGKIGMENIIKRLEQLYPPAHQLNITGNEDEFSGQLSMDLA